MDLHKGFVDLGNQAARMRISSAHAARELPLHLRPDQLEATYIMLIRAESKMKAAFTEMQTLRLQMEKHLFSDDYHCNSSE